jgi:hypothetical protein
MRGVLLLIAASAALAQTPAEFIHAVEFSYHAYPQSLWERELVWLRNIGIRTVAFSIPQGWHEPQPGKFDFTGATAPRRDLAGLLRLLRALEMSAWVRGRVPPQSREIVARGPLLRDAPDEVMEIGALAPGALARSRRALTQGVDAIVWREVEEYFVPAGWESPPGAIYRRGAVSMSGDESAAAAALRRNAAFLRQWAAVLPGMRAVPVRPVKGTLPRGVAAVQMLSRDGNGPSAVSVTNEADGAFEGELRVYLPALNRRIALPRIAVPTGGALWMPVRVPLSDPRLCRNCSVFANTDYIAYATAELHFLEYENGILAMEFAAPRPGEVVLQLSRQPNGPFLAAGHPAEFEWDAANMRARLQIPVGRGPGARVRISLAIDAPEASGFLRDLSRLLIGAPNTVAASFSSEELAARSRLRAPKGFVVNKISQHSAEVAYALTAPANAVHGEFVDLALEADGVTLGRARVPVLRPATLRFPQAIKLHAGAAEAPVDPPVISVDPRGSRNLEITVRNHSNEIRTFTVSADGPGLTFSPARTEISIGPAMQRLVSLRVFSGRAGLHEATVRLSGHGRGEEPVRLLAVPRNRAISWEADLDGDGIAEHVLENQRARAVFSTAGGRWLEFVWKDTGQNVLPEQGAFAVSQRVSIEAADHELRFRGPGWTRTATLDAAEASLSLEHSAPLPAIREAAPSGLRFAASPEGSGKTVFRIQPTSQ